MYHYGKPPVSWRPSDRIDVTNEEDIRQWARRLCVTPNELHEMIEEIGDNSARMATEFGLPLRDLLGVGEDAST